MQRRVLPVKGSFTEDRTHLHEFSDTGKESFPSVDHFLAIHLCYYSTLGCGPRNKLYLGMHYPATSGIRQTKFGNIFEKLPFIFFLTDGRLYQRLE
jgi:hypothetical protein